MTLQSDDLSPASTATLTCYNPPAAAAPGETFASSGVAGTSGASSASSVTMGGRSAHNGSSTAAQISQGDIEESNASDDENETSSDGSDSDEEDDQVPLGTKVPSAEELRLGDATQRHVAEMNFADAQKFLWKLSHMSEYDRECVEIRFRTKTAVAVVSSTSARKATRIKQPPRPPFMPGRLCFSSECRMVHY